MSKAINLGILTGNGTLTINLKSFFAYHWSVYTVGSDGGGSTAIEAGTVDDVVPVQIINPANGAHVPLVITQPGLYNFDVCCVRMDFVLTGATAPALNIFLFPEPRR